MPSLWEPERLQSVGSIVSRYAEFLREGDVVRADIEGDPCNVYRGEEPPSGVVRNLVRCGDEVRFEMHTPAGVVYPLDNLSVKRVWEVAPDHLRTFRGRVTALRGAGGMHPLEAQLHDIERGAGDGHPLEAQLHGAEQGAGDGHPLEAQLHGAEQGAGGMHPLEAQLHDIERGAGQDARHDFRAAVEENKQTTFLLDDRLKELEIRFGRLEENSKAYRDTMATAVRHLAGDVVRQSADPEATFSHDYAERFDRHEARYRGDNKRELACADMVSIVSGEA